MSGGSRVYATRRRGVVAGLFAVSGLAVAACSTPPDFSEGIDGFSQAIAAADATGKSLYTGAQKARQDILVRDLPRMLQQNAAFSLNPACDPAQMPDYKPGACTLDVTDQNTITARFGQPDDAPPMASLTRYAAQLSAVVADKTCGALQTDAAGIATSVGDIAKDGGHDVSAQAGAVSQIVSTIGCTVIAEEQLRILRASTSAADGIIGDLVVKIADVDDTLFKITLNNAYQQANAPLIDLAVARSKGTASLDQEQSDILQAIALAAAIDEARMTPPKPIILQIATLHHRLTEDLKAPTVSLARFQSDTQTFVTEVKAVASAAETLARPKNAPASAAAGAH
ncbi:MAG: hypothetical protein JO255_16875 [Alphaproteobacteria bacterium]|nr:hypothetical protein [Alphaproteobacteria bacterium]